MNQNNKTLTIDEAEEIYSISRKRLVKFIKEGKLKAIKIPGQTYHVKEEDIKEFIEKMNAQNKHK